MSDSQSLSKNSQLERFEVEDRLCSGPKVLVSSISRKEGALPNWPNNPPTMEGDEAANNHSLHIIGKYLELEPQSISTPSSALQTAVEGRAHVKPSENLPVLAAAIGLVLTLVMTQDARRLFWFWIASLLLTTCVACVDITSRYHASVHQCHSPAGESGDGFVPWLLFWNTQNFVAFFHAADDVEEYKPVLCFLSVLTGTWFIAEIVIIVRQSRKGQIRCQDRGCLGCDEGAKEDD
ncbi:hypothetical protein BT69DRAFT_1281367 [Atractiella rhizophila]|nr:hypothetical protein BT69DRAFT_1281367 [Atractiella rhizophila]